MLMPFEEGLLYKLNRLASLCGQYVGFVSHVRSREIDIIDLWFGGNGSRERGIHDRAYEP